MMPILPVAMGLSPIGPAGNAPEAFGAGSNVGVTGTGPAGGTGPSGGAASLTGPTIITDTFGKLLGQAVDAVNSTQSAADQAAQQLVTGQSTDIHSAMIAMEKAKVTFDLAVQVRNKTLDTYNQMMQIPV